MKKNKTILKILVVGIIIASIQFTLGFENIVFAEENTIDNNVTNEQNTVNETNNLNNTSETNETNATNTTNESNTNENNTTVQEPEKPVQDRRKEIQKLRHKIDTCIRIYNGKPIKTSINIYDGNRRLVENKDYRVIYRNNVNPGKATITVNGIGNYKGTISGRFFYIAPKQVNIRSAGYNRALTVETIRWQKDDKAYGYKVYRADSRNGTYRLVSTIKNKNIVWHTSKGLNPNKTYYFKVQAYIMVDNRQVAKTISTPKSALVSEVTLTATGSGSNRNYNLRKASNTINGLVLDPGETFNWFKVVGPASGRRGYKMASVFKNGQVTKGYGGGVCQVSSTLYQAARNAGLKIVERHIHSRPVTYTQLGNDATVSYGVQNLKIRNSKGYSIRLLTYANGQSTTCKIYCLAK